MNLKEYLKDKIQSLLIEHEEICYDCGSTASKYENLHEITDPLFMTM